MSNPGNHPLPGVPAVESPFFEQVFTRDRFTDVELRIARDLRDKGFAVFDFPDAELDRKSGEIIAALRDRYPWDQWRAGSADMRIQDAWRDNGVVRSIATNAGVIELLSKLYGRRAWPFQTLNFPVGTEQHFHTDSIHFSSVPERFMCGVWLALEDIGPDQGPLEYYVGSHRWPIYTNEHLGVVPEGSSNNQSTYHELWEGLVELTGVERQTFHARKGQALIWASNLLHGGMPHLDKTQTRWSQVTHYYFEDCAYYTPMHSDPFRGLIAFRQLTDVTTSQPVVNSFSRQPVSPGFMQAAVHGKYKPLSWTQRKLRRLKRKLTPARSSY